MCTDLAYVMHSPAVKTCSKVVLFRLALSIVVLDDAMYCCWPFFLPVLTLESVSAGVLGTILPSLGISPFVLNMFGAAFDLVHSFPLRMPQTSSGERGCLALKIVCNMAGGRGRWGCSLTILSPPRAHEIPEQERRTGFLFSTTNKVCATCIGIHKPASAVLPMLLACEGSPLR